MSYAEYLWRIQQNRTAVKVKLSDLRSNMDTKRLPQPLTEKDISRTKKYRRAYLMLGGVNDAPYDCCTVNPYALYDYLLSTGWEETEKQKEIKGVVVLKAPDSSFVVTIPINMALPEYEKMMAAAFDSVCCYKNVPASDVLRTLIDWKPH